MPDERISMSLCVTIEWERVSAMPKQPKPAPAPTGEPRLLSGGNPQIAKGEGDAKVQEYIAAMPGWKGDVGRRLDALIMKAVPGVAQGGEVEHAALRQCRRRLVHELSLLHALRESGLLPRRVAEAPAARPVEAETRALSRHPRERRDRRSAIHRLGETGEQTAGREDVKNPNRICVGQNGNLSKYLSYPRLIGSTCTECCTFRQISIFLLIRDQNS